MKSPRENLEYCATSEIRFYGRKNTAARESGNCRIVSEPTGGWHKVFLISSRVILSLPTSQLMNFDDMRVLKSGTQNVRKFLVSTMELATENVEI